jgi:hypothetical protein
VSHIEIAEKYARQASEEMSAGHYGTAQACASLATAFATLAMATRAPLRKEPSDCRYKANHPYMDEPCPVCGSERSKP